MCPGQEHGIEAGLSREIDSTSRPADGKTKTDVRGAEVDDGPPDWENMPLPPDWVLAHLTDAHCHPTDLTQSSETYDQVKLGGIAAMGTKPEDQNKVARLREERGWRDGEVCRKEAQGAGARVVGCFGYHPWFSHRYTFDPAIPKSQHYTNIFFPPFKDLKPDSARRQRDKEVLQALLPFLPDPIDFGPLIEGLKANIRAAKERGQLCMVGEVGLDGAARVVWPIAGRGLYDEGTRGLRDDWERCVPQGMGRENAETKKAEREEKEGKEGDDDDGWKRLTPFKISMEHQQAILRAQFEVAIEMGVPVSLHCVAASGPTMDILKKMRDTYGPRFTNRVNVDLHSGGGWSPEFWSQASAIFTSPSTLWSRHAIFDSLPRSSQFPSPDSYLSTLPPGSRSLQKQLQNLYASPSMYITGRNSNPAGLIRAIIPERMLVESDTHDVTRCTLLVWGAVEWIARVKEWRFEGLAASGEEASGEEEEVEEWGKEGLVESEERWVRRNTRKRGSGRGSKMGQDGRGEGEAAGEGKGEDEMEREEEEVVWAVRTLERNWARFMGLIEPYE